MQFTNTLLVLLHMLFDYSVVSSDYFVTCLHLIQVHRDGLYIFNQWLRLALALPPAYCLHFFP